MFHRWIATFSVMVLFVGGAASSFGDELFRVGIIGVDSYGAIAYGEFFNKPHAEAPFDNMRITTVYPLISSEYPESEAMLKRWLDQLLKMYQNPKTPEDAVPAIEVVDSMEKFLSQVDGVMLFSLDGKLHLEQATPVLKAGKPLFIGRPLASSPEDAVAILKLAAETKTPCWSSSQHRYSTGFSGMRNHPEVGNVLGCDIYGGWDEKAPEADQFSRPLHSIEAMYAIMGPGVVSVNCTSSPVAECITALWKDGRVGTYRGIKQGAIKYSATVFGEKGVSTAGIYGHGVPVNGIVPTNDKYVGYEPLAAEIAKFFKSGEVPVAPAETLEIYALIKAANESKANGGAVVPLKDLWEAKP